MKKLLFLAFALLLSLQAFSQDSSPLVCTNFVKIPNAIMDMEKLKPDQWEDWDNNKVARIKIKAHNFDPALMNNFTVFSKGPWITHKTFENDEIWIYLSSNVSGSIIIKYLGNFEYKLPYKLEPEKTYEMTLELQTATLIIKATPSDAKILVDDKEVGIGKVNMQVAAGIEHNYRIENEFYYSQTGAMTIAKNDTKTLEINLEPAYGYVKVTSTPVSGAKVFIDGVEAGTTPFLSDKLIRGDHRIEVKKDLYTTYSDIVTLDNGKKEEVTASLQPNYAKINVTTASDVQIWVNDEYKGIGSWNGVVDAGLCTVEARKDGYSPVTNTMILNVNEEKTVTLSSPTYKSKENTKTTTSPQKTIAKQEPKVAGTITFNKKSPTKLSLDGNNIVKADLTNIFYEDELKSYKQAMKKARNITWAFVPGYAAAGFFIIVGAANFNYGGIAEFSGGLGAEAGFIIWNILAVNKRAEKNLKPFINNYNSKHDVSLSVVPAPNGIGLRLSF